MQSNMGPCTNELIAIAPRTISLIWCCGELQTRILSHSSVSCLISSVHHVTLADSSGALGTIPTIPLTEFTCSYWGQLPVIPDSPVPFLTVPSLRGARVILPAGPGPSAWAAPSSHRATTKVWGNNQTPQGSPQSKGNKPTWLMLHILSLQANSLIDTLGDSQDPTAEAMQSHCPQLMTFIADLTPGLYPILVSLFCTLHSDFPESHPR